MSSPATWYVYMLCCHDKSLYTGITTDIERRVEEHNHSNKAAKYTRARRPVKLVYVETAANRAAASKREAAIKSLSSHEKRALIQR